MSRKEIKSTLEFDSVGAWADYTAAATPQPRAGSASESNGRGKEWDNGMTYEEALRVAQSGGYWAEGSKLLQKQMALAEQFSARVPMPRLRRDLVGGAPCVGAYCMGHPKSMFKRDKELAQGKPILTVAVCMGAYSGSTYKQKLNRGAAIMTAVNELETQGYRCELRLVHRLPDCPSHALKKWCNVEVVLKKAEEKFNPASCAFMLAHAAAHRHVMFKTMECTPIMAELTSCGYGYAGNMESLKHSLTEDFDLWFEGVTPQVGRQCGTTARAFEYVRGKVDEQLAQLATGAGQR